MFEIFEMEMPELGKKRKIRVWLPEAYQANPEQRFPVMYMHDAQNLFDAKDAAYGMIWDAHTAVQGLIDAQSGFSGCIIVGIDNAPGLERLNEYSPWASLAAKALKDLESVEGDIGGDGEAYGRFIVNTLKPFIDQRYRTMASREHTAVVGSSMGGFISLYLGSEYPEVFSKVGAFSTAVWFEEDRLLKQLEKVNPALETRWYLDVGTEETSNDSIVDFNARYINGSKNVVEKLKACGVPETHIRFVLDEGAVHNELAWAKRLPKALKWLFNLNA